MTSVPAGPSAPVRGASPEEILRRAGQARHAAGLWRRYSLSQRVDIVRSLWGQLSRRRAEILRLVHEETGAPPAEIEMLEIGGMERAVRYLTSNAHRILQDQAVWRPWFYFNKRLSTRLLPRGLVGVISSGRSPFLGPMEDSLAALLAGNAVLLKPSEGAARTALWAQEAVKACGLLPEGLLSVAAGGEAVGLSLVDCCDMVLYQGPAGAAGPLAEAAAKALKPLVLELEGKNAMIVFKDASLCRAAKAAVWGGFAEAGRLPAGVGRVFVESGAYEPFVAAVRREIALLRQSLAGKDVDLGRLAFPAQLKGVLEQLDEARRQGAQVLGGEVLDEAGLLMSPAVVLNARPDMEVMRGESLSPVLPIMSVESPEEAVGIVNEGPPSPYVSLWTADERQAERLGFGVKAGILGINDLAGGLGRRRGEEGLRIFCRPQAVCVHEWPADAAEPDWFPYEEMKTRLVGWVSRLM